jgi:hypothetical protein
MRIAIIGGGWVGCHLTNKLKQNHNVVLFEKKNELFTETSFNNQNRLHLGFHYARSHKTRTLCKESFNKFNDEYGFLIKNVKKNLYCVPKNKSLIDFQTYLKIFNDYSFTIEENKLNTLEGCINTNEKYIDFELAKKYFNQELKNNIIHKEITKKDLKKLSSEYDLVINCTNNFLKTKKNKNHYYELTISFLYEKIKDEFFDSLTLVDGTLFSIYPYRNNLYTVTDVEVTPLKKFNSIKTIENFKNELTPDYINKKRIKIEKKINLLYENFLNVFKYNSYYLSVKSKIKNDSDDRSPIIEFDDNIINTFTGKIQGIYMIEDFINNFLNNEKNRT